MNGVSRNIGFFLAGALLGGAAVALTTPLTGRRARRLIGKEFDRGSKHAERAVRDLQESGRKAYARGGELLHKAEQIASRAAAFGQ